jgi:tetratricopeptide (TPR) repeat protein
MNTLSSEIHRHWHAAETALIKKDWLNAKKHYLSIIDLDNQHVHSLIRLASIQLQLGDYNSARHYTTSAYIIDTDDEAAIMMIARQLMLFSEPQKLSHYLAKINFHKFKNPMALVEMSVLLNAVGENNHALTFVNRAIEYDSRFVPAFYFRGNLHTFTGNQAQARVDLEHCLELNPRYAQAYWALSGLPHKSSHIEALRKQLNQAKPGGNDEIYFSYALHNELHKQLEIASSWQALEYACKAKRKKITYSSADTRALFESLKSINWNSIAASATPHTKKNTPIFIVGMHRSGTTLLEQLLAGHSEITDGGESSAFLLQLKRASNWPGELTSELAQKLGFADLSPVADWFNEASTWRLEDTHYFTEKQPSNFLLIGFILKAIPNAKIIHLVRDPISTCFSNLRTLFNLECGYSYDQYEIADYFYWYRDLMAFWHRQFPEKVLDVAYQNLVIQPEESMQKICSYLHLEHQNSMYDLGSRKNNVTTASAASIREGIQSNRNEQWMPYAEHLAPLLERLKSHNLIT